MKRILAVLLLAGCSHARPTVAAAPPPREPTPSEQLAQLSGEYWAELMHRSPLWATDLGDHSHDAELDDVSAAAQEAHLMVLGSLRGRLSRVDRSTLGEKERVTAEVLDVDLQNELSVARACKGWLWSVDQLDGPQVDLSRIPEIEPVGDDKALADLVSRYRKVAKMYADMVANRREGMAQGLVPARINVERVIGQLDDLLAVPPEKSSFASVKMAASWSEDQKAKARAAILAAVKEGPYPGMQQYRSFLKDELLPKSRTQVGVSALPGGAACYAAHIAAETGLSKSADEIHELGLSEVKRIDAEMQALARKAGARTPKAYLARIEARKDDHVATREEYEARAAETLKRALAALPKAFDKLPATPIEVKRIDPWQEKDAPDAYYFQAPTDRSRPAYFRLNTYEPATRPLFSLPALTFHEGVPGHHVQIALQIESGELPEFRKQVGQTAFTEGWALYAEGLADELGLYRTPEEQMGRLDYELWRASRLVVDTGMHSKGWTRDQAIRYLRSHTAASEGEIVNEIDRYIEWPGQALAYKLGELEIRRLRAEAEKQLGPKFDLKKFHEVVLSDGATPLSVLQARVEAWEAASR